MDLLMREPLDAEAFDALSRRMRRPLYAFVTAVMLDAGAAEDVTQRAFELALARRQSFRPERGSVEAWLFGIARNVALDERRARERRSAVVDPALRGSSDGHVEQTDRRAALLAALRTLEPSERELIALKFWSDRSNREIAAIVGCSESNVGTRLHRAITKLREICDDLV